MSDGAEVWVTVPEAARRLGIGERQARRWAGRLPDADRSETGRVRRVRLAAIEGLRAAAVVDADAERSSGGPEADADRTETGPGPDVSGHDREDWRARALVAEARAELLAAERDRLADALAREQEIARLEAENHRAALMLAGRKSAPMLEGHTAPDPGQGGESAAREGEGGSTGRTEGRGAPPASWWARLWGKG